MKFKEKIADAFYKSKESLVKASPDILIIAGVIGFVGAAVLACRATLKAEKIVEETKEGLEKIEEAKDLSTEDEYTEKDIQKDTVTVYTNAAVKFVKLYGPSLILAGVSAGMIFKSHGILKGRLHSTAAALAVTEKLFESYRERVREKYGEEEDKNLFYNYQKKTVEVQNDDDDTKKFEEFRTSETADISPLSVFYGPEYNDHVPPTPALMRVALKNAQDDLQDRLNRNRHAKVYIRDILIRLGYGYDYTDSNELYLIYGFEHGDIIDFEIENKLIPGNANFVMGRTDTCLINFKGAHRLIDFA